LIEGSVEYSVEEMDKLNKMYNDEEIGQIQYDEETKHNVYRRSYVIQ